jgi:glycerate dehydrogenase
MKIVVLDGYTLNPGDNPWSPVEALGELTVYDRTAPERLIEYAKDADVILTNKTPISAETLVQLPRLKFIAVLATGYNVVDVVAARKRNIPVSNVPIYGTDTVAEFVMGLLLELWKQPGLHSKLVKEGAWAECPDFCFWESPLTELADKTIGIIGFGRIGKRVAQLAEAFKMNVLVYNRSQIDTKGGSYRQLSLPEVFKQSDIVTLHCPLTDENAGMVKMSLLSQMKRSAVLINTARGPLVNEADLAAALNNDVIAGAAVDVVSVEPIVPENPLPRAKNLIITPHIAWATLEARTRLMQTSSENIRAFQEGKPIHLVN